MEPITQELTLPVSGTKILISNRRLKVRDNDAALQLIGPITGNPAIKLQAARIAMLCTLANGEPIRYEDVLDWDEDDMARAMATREDPGFFQTSAGPS